ncbi:MAG: hypothetical protein ABI634_14105 [Acidobacteriota bacterium]
MTTATVDAVISQAEQDEAARHQDIDRVVAAWTPRGDRLVLARMRPLERRHGSLVIPGRDSVMGDRVKTEGMLFRVVKAGPDAVTSVGAQVYCASFAGAMVDVDGHALLVIKEEELLLVGTVDTGRPVQNVMTLAPD